MDRSKLVAMITGAIALLLGIAYLLLVQILDFRGEMIPAPVELSMEMRSSQVPGSVVPWSIFLLSQSP
jgi:hypothetical protein